RESASSWASSPTRPAVCACAGLADDVRDWARAVAASGPQPAARTSDNATSRRQGTCVLLSPDGGAIGLAAVAAAFQQSVLPGDAVGTAPLAGRALLDLVPEGAQRLGGVAREPERLVQDRVRQP